MKSKFRRPPARPRVLVAQSWWQDRLLEGISQYAAKPDWILDCEMRWSHRVPLAGEWQGDGIIAYVGITKPEKRLIHFIRTQRVPVVLAQPPGEGLKVPRVIIPHEEVGRAAAEHLLGLNFRHFGFVEFADNIMERERGAGFRKAANQTGNTFHVIRLRDLPTRLRLLPRPMGLFAINDLNALAVMRACVDRGFRVPEEFAIIGADNTEILCKFAPVPLSSVNCNFEKQGFEAAALLHRLMRGEAPPPLPVLILPDGVTGRRSTDTLAIPDADATHALRFLRDHFREPVRMARIAVGLTHSLRRAQSVFRSSTGRTMFQELTRLRLEHAKSLLLNPELKITTVAEESGFGNRYHLIRAFRRATGQTPRAYRKNVGRIGKVRPAR